MQAWIAKAEARNRAIEASRRLAADAVAALKAVAVCTAMIRVLLFLALVALLAFGVVWFADRPGEVAITWQG